jgi:pyridoxamine 5'-phosphate oxidase
MAKKNISNLRRSYSAKKLMEDSVALDPFKQFSVWMNDAINSNIIEPNAMILATANSGGIPSARVVLLKDFNEKGFVFFTNYKSSKAKDLSENPNASLLFFWDVLERQVRVNGKVKKVSVEESEEYFKSRPRENQLGAWASEQSSVLKNRKVLDEKYKFFMKQFKGKEIPLPEFWGGYCIIPNKFEFWQGRENRLHDRILYRKIRSKWKIERLSP